jgi:hypothetical protein
MSPSKISHIYNPQNQSDQELLENFVIRIKEFNKIMRSLKTGDLESLAQHFLIEGQRGSGKTTLLFRLRYEIEQNAELHDHLIPIQFGEEQYGIFDLCRIWESGAEYLEEIEGFESLSDALDGISQSPDYTTECFKLFERYLIQNNKRALFLIDNFGDILDRLSSKEQMKLRDIFHTSNHIQFITSSSRTLEYTYKHDQPFFEFFKVIKLEGLDKEQTITLLKQLAKTAGRDISQILENQPGRIETIRRLTGGIPRTIILLFEMLMDNSADVFEDLELILDRVTPLYKHRMDDLPTQQQAIVDTIALNWDGITPKEIVERLKQRGFDTKKVSSQLNALEKNAIVLSKKFDKKNKIYMLKERFFNIWYLMRYGRKKNRQQVLWLVKFLQEWCSGEELQQQVRELASIEQEHNEFMQNVHRVIDECVDENESSMLTRYFMLLLVKKQYRTTLMLFERYPSLIDQLKPLYYTTLHFLKDEYPKEYLKMGEELAETIDEALQQVESMQERYN